MSDSKQCCITLQNIKKLLSIPENLSDKTKKNENENENENTKKPNIIYEPYIDGYTSNLVGMKDRSLSTYNPERVTWRGGNRKSKKSKKSKKGKRSRKARKSRRKSNRRRGRR